MEKTFNAISYINTHNLTFYLDKNSNLYFSECTGPLSAIEKMPWKFQLPFYLTFLRDDTLAERFKDMEILGAIDLYIKWKFCLQEELCLVETASSECA